MIRTRFAPSPSGYLHIGNMRTALWNYLYATHHNGAFIVRIENTDQTRSTDEYSQAIVRDLAQLGIQHTEYIEQQNRQAVYDQKMKQLQDSGHVYPCFCSKEKLSEVRAQQAKQGKPPRYNEQCRSLSQEEQADYLRNGVPYVWRFVTPPTGTITLKDEVRNKVIDFACEHLEDFVIQRTDESYVFLFTNIVDDIVSGITHVIRGEDHLSNTPKQALICRALAATPPTYIHCPLIVGEDKKPLSKRDGVFDVQSLLAAGYRVDALCNYLARIGYQHTNTHTPDMRVYDMTELAAQFDISNISLSATTFAPKQLDEWQKRALDALSAQAWCDWAACALDEQMRAAVDITIIESWARDNCVQYADIARWAKSLATGEPHETAHKAMSKYNDAQRVLAVALAQSDTPNWKQLTAGVQAATDCRGKNLFMPLRIALSGQTSGPPLDSLWTILSVAERTRRLSEWHKKVCQSRSCT